MVTSVCLRGPAWISPFGVVIRLREMLVVQVPPPPRATNCASGMKRRQCPSRRNTSASSGGSSPANEPSTSASPRRTTSAASDGTSAREDASAPSNAGLRNEVKVVFVTREDLKQGLTPVRLIDVLFEEGHRGVTLDVDRDPMFKIRFDEDINEQMQRGFLDELHGLLRDGGAWRTIAARRYGLRPVGKGHPNAAGAYFLREWYKKVGDEKVRDSVPISVDDYVGSAAVGEPPLADDDHPSAKVPRDYLKREHIQRLTEPVSAAADDLEEDLSPKERLSRERVVYANEIPMDGDSLFESLSGVPPIESDMDKILDGRKIPGVNTWFFYVAREHSMAYMHVENLSMFSINYMLPNSATKVWCGFHQRYANRVNRILLEMGAPCRRNGKAKDVCEMFLQHRNLFFDEEFFIQHRIPYFVAEQASMEAIVTLPGGYHQTISTGVSYSEAINFLVFRHWVKTARETRLCRSFCIDQVDEAADEWQPLRDALYTAEKDFVVTKSHAEAEYPDVCLSDGMRRAYRDKDKPPQRTSTQQSLRSRCTVRQKRPLSELLSHVLKGDRDDTLNVEAVLQAAADANPSDKETQGSVRREKKRKRKQVTDAANYAKKLAEDVERREAQAAEVKHRDQNLEEESKEGDAEDVQAVEQAEQQADEVEEQQVDEVEVEANADEQEVEANADEEEEQQPDEEKEEEKEEGKEGDVEDEQEVEANADEEEEQQPDEEKEEEVEGTADNEQDEEEGGDVCDKQLEEEGVELPRGRSSEPREVRGEEPQREMTLTADDTLDEDQSGVSHGAEPRSVHAAVHDGAASSERRPEPSALPTGASPTLSQIQSQPWPDAEEEAPTPSPPPKDVPPVKRPAPPPVKQRHQKSAPVTRKRVYFDDSDEEEERPTITASCKPQRPLPPPVKQPGREPKEVPPVKRRAPSSVEKPCPGPVPDKRKPPVNRDEKDEPSKPGGSGSSVVKPSTTDTPVGKKAERASIDDNGKSDAGYKQPAQKLKDKLRTNLAETKRLVENKQRKLEEFQAELLADPPGWLLKAGPARVERERQLLKARIQRYMGELEFLHNKYEDLEKTRIVFRALDAYYSKRHGTNEKFMALVAAGYTNPIEVVAHFWLGESIEVRSMLCIQCVAHSAKLFEEQPEKLKQWVDAFDTLEHFNAFFEVKLDEFRKRRAVSR